MPSLHYLCLHVAPILSIVATVLFIHSVHQYTLYCNKSNEPNKLHVLQYIQVVKARTNHQAKWSACFAPQLVPYAFWQCLCDLFFQCIAIVIGVNYYLPCTRKIYWIWYGAYSMFWFTRFCSFIHTHTRMIMNNVSCQCKVAIVVNGCTIFARWNVNGDKIARLLAFVVHTNQGRLVFDKAHCSTNWSSFIRIQKR